VVGVKGVFEPLSRHPSPAPTTADRRERRASGGRPAPRHVMRSALIHAAAGRTTAGGRHRQPRQPAGAISRPRERLGRRSSTPHAVAASLRGQGALVVLLTSSGGTGTRASPTPSLRGMFGSAGRGTTPCWKNRGTARLRFGAPAAVATQLHSPHLASPRGGGAGAFLLTGTYTTMTTGTQSAPIRR
jgi:hypothetical protein